MQSINSSRSKFSGKKTIFISSIALLFIIAGTLYYTETHHLTSLFVKTNNKSPSTPQQKEDATKNDQTTASNSAKSDTQPAPGVNRNQTTSQVPISTTSNVTITSINQVNKAIDITATITNPAPSGVCTITFTKNGAKPVTRTIDTTSETCATSIPELEFSMIGDWQAQVIYFANNTQTTTTGTITIK